MKFQESRLLEVGRFGYDATYDDMESRLDKLFHLTKKILRDTGRKDWNLTAFTNEREISANDVIALIMAWYSTNGREEYAKMLRERFQQYNEQTPTATPTASPTNSTAVPTSKPVVTAFTGPTKFEFDDSLNVVGLYKSP